MNRVIAVMLGVCLLSNVFAADSLSNAKAVSIRVDSSGKDVVYFDRPLGGTPQVASSVRM